MFLFCVVRSHVRCDHLSSWKIFGEDLFLEIIMEIIRFYIYERFLDEGILVVVELFRDIDLSMAC